MRCNFLIVILTLAVVIYAVHNNEVDWRERVNCFPDPNPEEAKCKERGCVWDNATYDESTNVPLCYFPKTTGLFFESHTKDKEEYILIKEQFPPVLQNPACPFMADIQLIKLSTSYYGSVFNIRIEPKDSVIPRFEPDVKTKHPNYYAHDTFIFETNENVTSEIFTFKVRRYPTNILVWDTSLGGLMFADKYIQIATRLPTDKMYGFGENTHQTLKHDFSKYKTWSMFARDEPPNSVGEDTKNLYGVHPFYMMLEEDGKAHGVLILNSNAQEVTTGPGPHLVYRTIGGILDIYFFPGPKPEDVVRQYQTLIGTPFMPPYWALGFQLSRYGYKNLDELKMIVERNLKAKIPLEVVYADIDYMDRYADFTTGKEWTDFGAYVKDLHDGDLKVILIFDPAIDVTTEPFKRALDADASFIEYERFDQVQNEVNDLYELTNNTKIMLSVVWPDNHAAFPDFYDPTNITQYWWISEFDKFHKNQVEFDGIWIDMNEPAAFGTNEEHPWYFDDPDHPNITSLNCEGFSETDGVYDYAPFQTSAVYRYNNGTDKQSLLSQKTLCMLARTHRGKEVFYNTKNLYGLYEAIATRKAAEKATGKRAAVVSRSTFVSSGRYTGHWLGDNTASWDDLRTSIIGVQEFNIFGIPYVGSDVCGFNQEVAKELCLRWQQVGAFHPFYRNHNNKDSPPQDPAQWPEVAKATRLVNNFRYSFLTFLYSLHYEAAKHGGTVVRPVFFEFPDDSVTHNLSYQFMWGDSMMVAPVTEERVNNVSVYLPPSANWYSLREDNFGQQAKPGWNVVSATQSELIPVYMKGGTIIPRQEGRMTTTETRAQPLTLLIAASQKNSDGMAFYASGNFFWDDGITIFERFIRPDCCEVMITFSANPLVSSLRISLIGSLSAATMPPITSIFVFGVSFPYFGNLTINGQVQQSYSSISDEFEQTLLLDRLNIQLKTNLVDIIWFYQ